MVIYIVPKCMEIWNLKRIYRKNFPEKGDFYLRKRQSFALYRQTWQSLWFPSDEFHLFSIIFNFIKNMQRITSIYKFLKNLLNAGFCKSMRKSDMNDIHSLIRMTWHLQTYWLQQNGTFKLRNHITLSF